MKKTININIQSISFKIEEEAYSLLDNYLKAIKSSLSNEEFADEIFEDIESRVAELLYNWTKGNTLIVLNSNIDDLISTLGKPSSFSPIEEENFHNEIFDNQVRDVEQKVTKTLFRNPHNRLIGGVFSGLSKYLGVSVIVLRLLALVGLYFFGDFFFFTYLIFWFIVPKVRTSSDYLKMEGEKIDINNLTKTFNTKVEDNMYVSKLKLVFSPVSQLFKHLIVKLKEINILYYLIFSTFILITIFSFLEDYDTVGDYLSVLKVFALGVVLFLNLLLAVLCQLVLKAINIKLPTLRLKVRKIAFASLFFFSLLSLNLISLTDDVPDVLKDQNIADLNFKFDNDYSLVTYNTEQDKNENLEIDIKDEKVFKVEGYTSIQYILDHIYGEGVYKSEDSKYSLIFESDAGVTKDEFLDILSERFNIN